MARLNLAHSRVRAPFDGAIADRVGTAGDYVKAGTPLYRVVNDSVLKFIVQAPESFASQVQKGQLVRFTVDAYPDRVFEGNVFLISPQVNLSTRAFSFGALVSNSERLLKASSFARGELVLESEVLSIQVPIEAVQVSSGIARVYVVEKDVVRTREIKLGPIHQGRQEVLQGVTAGESMVTSGQSKLREGAAVIVRPPPLSESARGRHGEYRRPCRRKTRGSRGWIGGTMHPPARVCHDDQPPVSGDRLVLFSTTWSRSIAQRRTPDRLGGHLVERRLTRGSGDERDSPF